MIEKTRIEYNKAFLSINDLDNNPIHQFKKWMDLALAEKVDEPNAMCLTTVGENASPSSRIVLLREIKEDGLLFYTNYNSRKGVEISESNKVCVLFFWSDLQKQIRIEGQCVKTSPEKSDAYFYSRPIESQLASIASAQSNVLKDKDVLMQRFENEKQKYATHKEIKRPENWGGYEINPNYFEFWQGGTHRLHDRFCYRLQANSWKITRLAP